MKTIDGYDVKIFTDNIEENALEQIKILLSIDVFSDKKIRIMPDVHAGAGCVIGFTGNLGDKVIPNIVGVDIGCGMRILNLGKIENIDFHAFHEHIRGNIPSGKIVREDRFGFKPLVNEEMEIYREAKKLVTELYCYRELKDSGRINKAIGSLGGGNHFIELDKDDEGNVYLVIHTGSRNLGKQVADIYQNRAIKHLTEGADEFEETIKRTIEEYKAAGRRSELQSVIKQMRKSQQDAEPMLPRDLCYVENDAREDYLHDMRICQRWAVLNRKLISLLLLKFFPNVNIVEEFESIHNYISNNNIIRKGSISAAEGERCIIPLNMRDGSLLCTGKGNPDWNYSAPHGAGRVLSRTQAYAQIKMEDFEASMAGIYSESVNDFTRDESPMVYKPADEIIANIGDTVSIDTIIRPIFNFKAS
ncbi:RtcB family protein [Bacteroides acidifaciens]|jgi:RNA-splicing ligase RtcB|uniref:3'-phosphate/5'-hydroxy nucleic acid ligase n=2 Tax=Bacteroides acidifaciens TaxID=85831 RepID=A0A7J0A180_9BACE|nr:RtcB family protein [Bacteroides acidifaciens]MBF0728640.1 RtcB family protein [Bacteroides acidifaciens]MBF0834028.1 RtcB family protein [Bacteroides acidifaciens]NDO53621.1 RtcB family protein [Bacteroides acidifaciens]TFU51883.1 RNA-splicing ligase RtcB [Bacteroides acidifaciens]GFH86133.1 RNA-splicing ligase RtcB [Bacteroides acidifaciens]